MPATDTKHTIRIEEPGHRAEPGDAVVFRNLDTDVAVTLTISTAADPGPAAKLALLHETGDEFEIPLRHGPVTHRFEAIERMTAANE